MCPVNKGNNQNSQGTKAWAVERVRQNLDLVLSQIVSHILSFMLGGIAMEQIHPACSEAGRLSFLHVVNYLGQTLASVVFTIDVPAPLKQLYSICALTIKIHCKHSFL